MEAIGRLAGGVAHDFNNVLSVILSYSEFIVENLEPGDPMRDDVEQIKKAGLRAADLTRQLLMFSRQEVVEPKVLDLNDLLGKMHKMLRRVLGEDIELESLPASALGRIRADRGHIEQVIMNLAVNARDAMPTGGKLTIETENIDLDETHARDHLGVVPGRYVMLAVSDNGTGMDRATQTRIFEPFFTTKPKDKGTGLGLSTVFGIVQQSGGSVWVYSEPGLGTSYKIYLPCVDAMADEVAPTDAAASKRRRAPRRSCSSRTRTRFAPSRAGSWRATATEASSRRATAVRPPAPERATRGRDRLARDRRRDAADERPRAREATGARAPRDEDPLHVGLHRRRDRAARRPRSGRWRRIPAEAAHAGRKLARKVRAVLDAKRA